MLGLLKHLGVHNNILRICEGPQPHYWIIVGISFNFVNVLFREAIHFNDFKKFLVSFQHQNLSIQGFSLILNVQ